MFNLAWGIYNVVYGDGGTDTVRHGQAERAKAKRGETLKAQQLNDGQRKYERKFRGQWREVKTFTDTDED